MHHDGRFKHRNGRLGLVLGLVLSLENMEESKSSNIFVFTSYLIGYLLRKSTVVSHTNVTNHGATLAFARCASSPQKYTVYMRASMCIFVNYAYLSTIFLLRCCNFQRIIKLLVLLFRKDVFISDKGTIDSNVRIIVDAKTIDAMFFLPFVNVVLSCY